MRKLASFFLALAILPCASSVLAREWTDSTGKFKFKADLITFSDRLAVLKRGDKKLVAVPVDKLSEADKEFIQAKQSEARSATDASEQQTWTFVNGQQAIGHVVDYARKQLTIQRRRGSVFINDRAIQNIPDVYKRMIPHIVGHFENVKLESTDQLDKWLAPLKGAPREYSVEGVLLQLENGDEVGVPFFFFSEDDLKVLKPGWDRWVATEKDQQMQADHALVLQGQAEAYQRDKEMQEQTHMMKLEALAYLTGDLWEVRLYPANPRAGMPLSVVIPARNSRAAAEIALSQHPGYNAGPVSRVSP